MNAQTRWDCQSIPVAHLQVISPCFCSYLTPPHQRRVLLPAWPLGGRRDGAGDEPYPSSSSLGTGAPAGGGAEGWLWRSMCWETVPFPRMWRRRQSLQLTMPCPSFTPFLVAVEGEHCRLMVSETPRTGVPSPTRQVPEEAGRKGRKGGKAAFGGFFFFGFEVFFSLLFAFN